MQLQSEVGSSLRALSRPQSLAEKVVELIAKRMNIDAVLLLFRVQEGRESLAVASDPRDMSGDGALQRLCSVWSRHFGTDKKGISRDEAETDPACDRARPELLETFAALKAELLLSITFEEEIVGFLALGRKQSGQGYSADDFKLLCILADQIALALKNGALFEETERNKEQYQLLYDQSQTLNKKLIEVDRQKKQFVANISHELRTPISTILGYSEVLLDHNFRGDARAVLERVVTNGQELSQLMDSLLDFSRLETGSMTVDLQEVNVREMLQSLEIMAKRLIKGRPIRFRLEVEPWLERMETDPKKLQQILMQLLTNAVKFTERGEIALEMKAQEGQDSAFIAISVSDTGIGISKRDQEVIFEEFRQLDGSSTRQYGGTGLGLGLCKKLVQSLGGQIQVESEVGRGSVFNLLLPVRSPRLAVAGNSAA
jgi:signal transduction histidine kinase